MRNKRSVQKLYYIIYFFDYSILFVQRILNNVNGFVSLLENCWVKKI